MNFYACQQDSQYNSFDEYPVYDRTDLGMTYTPSATILKVYSPAVQQMEVFLYKDGHTDSEMESHQMTKNSEGVWKIKLNGDFAGQYYNFQATKDGTTLNRVPDPYAVAVGLNGTRAMILDMATTNPPGWDSTKRPTLSSPADIILYEAHVRDISAHPESGIDNKRKFKGLVEPGTKNKDGLSTGLDHIKDLGITHIHLLPSFDFMPRSTDEANPVDFNWGYDPQNYNVPEGAYATDPYQADVRIREFKEMVQAFHQNGIRVVMDVVYNHTGETENSVLNQIAPGYYYRFNEDGSFSNASGCGNETASERPMVRKFIIESMLHWAKEYHIDGFRIDLMAIHDIETINAATAALKAFNPDIFVYGEGWTAGDSPLPVEKRALKAHARQLNDAAVFSDDIRDGIKGSVFNHTEKGFASGDPGREMSIKFGVVGATEHPQIDYPAVNYSDAPYANRPTQCINYASCHDNHTLYDRLVMSTEVNGKKRSDEILGRMHRLANSIVLTSQGVPFLHAGSELMRTKDGDENSYKSSESINQIDWPRKKSLLKHFNYYKDLIAFRKKHPAFRMPTTEMIQNHLTFLPVQQELMVAFLLKDHANGDRWKDIVVVYNANENPTELTLPEGKWTTVVWDEVIDESGVRTVDGTVEVPGISLGVFFLK